MEELRTGIGLVGYGQRDPLVEYKAQAYHRFQELLSTIEATLVRNIFKVEVEPQTPQVTITEQPKKLSLQGASESDAGGGFDKEEKRKTDNGSHKTNDKIGRNELCPCGSGKKYKKCCGK
jgi:preprotein translocase subunit SecA